MKNEISESVYDINMDKLCQNSIELIKYAQNMHETLLQSR